MMGCIRGIIAVFVIFFTWVFLSSAVYAAQIIQPNVIVIHNNVQANIKLSLTDINRFFVRGQKITSIDAPSGLLSAHNDSSGSVYVNIYGHTPFTAFVSTNEGLHFSLLIMPAALPGKTIAFKVMNWSPKQSSHYQSIIGKPNTFEKRTPYQKLLVELIRKTMLGKVPPGYTSISPNGFSQIPQFKTIPSIAGLNQQVKYGLLGGQLAVRTILVANTRKTAVRLFENEFYAPGVRAVAIAQQYLPSHGKTFVYEVLSNA